MTTAYDPHADWRREDRELEMNFDRAKVGDLIIIPRGGNSATYAFVIRTRSDAADYRRCAHCGHAFGYGAIAHCGHAFGYGAIARCAVTNDLVCAFPCKLAR